MHNRNYMTIVSSAVINTPEYEVTRAIMGLGFSYEKCFSLATCRSARVAMYVLCPYEGECEP